MKKIVSICLLSAVFSVSSFGLSLTDTTQETSSIDTQSSEIGSVLLDTMTSDLEQSRKSLNMSIDLLNASKAVDNGTELNEEYITAMLRLSDDIGAMADRIGTMADRIVKTELLIGDMADRIVTVSNMIIENNAQTQRNLLEAQKNFNTLLISLNQ